MSDSLLLAAAALSSLAGMSWLALAMDVHWRQACKAAPSARRSLVLRVLGVTALAASLSLCLAVDHVSMAALVWVMCMAAAALTVAFTLTTKPRLLAALLPGFSGNTTK
jgi:hypothetical protein